MGAGPGNDGGYVMNQPWTDRHRDLERDPRDLRDRERDRDRDRDLRGDPRDKRGDRSLMWDRERERDRERDRWERDRLANAHGNRDMYKDKRYDPYYSKDKGMPTDYDMLSRRPRDHSGSSIPPSSVGSDRSLRHPPRENPESVPKSSSVENHPLRAKPSEPSSSRSLNQNYSAPSPTNSVASDRSSSVKHKDRLSSVDSTKPKDDLFPHLVSEENLDEKSKVKDAIKQETPVPQLDKKHVKSSSTAAISIRKSSTRSSPSLRPQDFKRSVSQPEPQRLAKDTTASTVKGSSDLRVASLPAKLNSSLSGERGASSKQPSVVEKVEKSTPPVSASRVREPSSTTPTSKVSDEVQLDSKQTTSRRSITSEVDDKVEDKTENKPEDKLEDKPEDKPEEKFQAIPEEKSEEKSEEKYAPLADIEVLEINAGVSQLTEPAFRPPSTKDSSDKDQLLLKSGESMISEKQSTSKPMINSELEIEVKIPAKVEKVVSPKVEEPQKDESPTPLSLPVKVSTDSPELDDAYEPEEPKSLVKPALSTTEVLKVSDKIQPVPSNYVEQKLVVPIPVHRDYIQDTEMSDIQDEEASKPVELTESSTIPVEKISGVPVSDGSELKLNTPVKESLPTEVSPNSKSVEPPSEPVVMFPLNRLEQALYEVEHLSKAELYKNMKYYSSHPIKSLSEYPFYRENQKFNNIKVHDVLVDRIAEHRKDLHNDSLVFRQRFDDMKSMWLRYCMNVEKKEGSKTSVSQSLSMAQSPQIAKENNQPSSGGRRGRNHGDSVRSEAEFLEILANFERESARDPSMRATLTSAHVPDLIYDPIERDEIRYIDSNNFVEDKSIPYQRLITDGIDNFTPEEHEAFCEAYVLAPKQFGKIAKTMGGCRTFNDCVLHYYRTKKQVDYKALLLNKSKRNSRKGRKKVQKDKPQNGSRQQSEGITEGTPIQEDVQKSVAQSPSTVSDIDSAHAVTPGEEAKVIETEDLKRPLPDHDVEGRKRAKKNPKVSNSTRREKARPDEASSSGSVELPTLSPVLADKELILSQQPVNVQPIHPRERAVSYWSVYETNLFQQLLLSYGTNWEKFAKHFKSKSVVMVKNYFAKHAESKGWAKLAIDADERINQGLPVPVPPHIPEDVELRKRGTSSRGPPETEKMGQQGVQPTQHPVSHGHYSSEGHRVPVSIAPAQPTSSSAEIALMSALDKKLNSPKRNLVTPVQRPQYPSQSQSPSQPPSQSQAQPLSQHQPRAHPQPELQSKPLPRPQSQPQSQPQPQPHLPSPSSIQQLLQASEEVQYSPSMSGASRALPVPSTLRRSDSPQSRASSTIPPLTHKLGAPHSPKESYETSPSSLSNLDQKSPLLYSYNNGNYNANPANNNPVVDVQTSLPSATLFESSVRSSGYYLPQPKIPSMQSNDSGLPGNNNFYLQQQQRENLERERQAQEEMRRAEEQNRVAMESERAREKTLELERMRQIQQRERDIEETQRQQQKHQQQSTPLVNSPTVPTTYSLPPFSPISSDSKSPVPSNFASQPDSVGRRGLSVSSLTDVPTNKSPYHTHTTLPIGRSDFSHSRGSSLSSILNPIISEGSPQQQHQTLPSISPIDRSAYNSGGQALPKAFSQPAPSSSPYLPSLSPGIQPAPPSRGSYVSMYTGRTGSPVSAEAATAAATLAGAAGDKRFGGSSLYPSQYMRLQEPTASTPGYSDMSLRRSSSGGSSSPAAVVPLSQQIAPLSNTRSTYLPLPSLSGRSAYSPSQSSTPSILRGPPSSTPPPPVSHDSPQIRPLQASPFSLYQDHYRSPDQAIDQQPSRSLSSFVSNTRDTPSGGVYGYEFPSRESNERGVHPSEPLHHTNPNSHQQQQQQQQRK